MTDIITVPGELNLTQEDWFDATRVRRMKVSDLLEQYEAGDDHGWQTEFDLLRTQHAKRIAELTVDIAAHGVREPVLLGNDGRVWDGMHRLCVCEALDVNMEIDVFDAPADDAGTARTAVETAVQDATTVLAQWRGDLTDDVMLTPERAAALAVHAALASLRPDLHATLTAADTDHIKPVAVPPVAS